MRIMNLFKTTDIFHCKKRKKQMMPEHAIEGERARQIENNCYQKEGEKVITRRPDADVINGNNRFKEKEWEEKLNDEGASDDANENGKFGIFSKLSIEIANGMSYNGGSYR